ncbi:hypothetical protein GF376_03505 [Candidatus Peregrinibacteria bacterium]|nr:hypothetical protein [Candidatus Peregrinibacteria bacterium]
MFKGYFTVLLAFFSGLIGANEISNDSDLDQIKLAQAAPEIILQADEPLDFKEKIQELGITLHPGTDYRSDSTPSRSLEKNCHSLVYQTLKKFPQNWVDQLDNLTLYYSNQGRRGLGGGNTIILRCKNVDNEELVAVLVHEMAHIVDTGVIDGTKEAGESNFRDGSKPVYNNDKSLYFYRISFIDDKTVKSEATELDFVSGYAMTDPFEDFAESFTYYIIHGDKFRKLIKKNEALEKKYYYLKNRIFNGKEFYEISDNSVLDLYREYDTTALKYNLEYFLAF